MPTPRAQLGAKGEELARDFLRQQGYQILTSNYRCRHGEIDIVAQEGEDLVFVEVRSRRSTAFGIPEESLTRAKIRHLTASSQHYLQEHASQGVHWRIDLISIRFGAGYQLESLNHLPHAVES